MSLRKKSLILIAFTFIVLILLLYFVSRTILLDSYSALEAQTTEANMQRVANLVRDEIAALHGTGADWAGWDDTYAFAQDGNQEYIDLNTADETFQNLQINMMVFINLEGDIVFAKVVDLATMQALEVPPALVSAIAEEPLLNPADTENTAGILMLPESPLILSIRPILTSQQAGPKTGTLIMGRFIDEAKIASWSESTGFPIQFATYSGEIAGDFQAASTALSQDHPIFVQPLTDRAIAAYGLLTDIRGASALMLRLEMVRSVYIQGWATINYFILALALLGVVIAGVLMFLLERLVLARLAKLNHEINLIRSEVNPAARVTAEGSDELSNLANTLNNMLNALAESQRSIHESEAQLQSVLMSHAPVTLLALDKDGAVSLLKGRGVDVSSFQRSAKKSKIDTGEYQAIKPMVEQSTPAFQGYETNNLVEVGDKFYEVRYSPMRSEQGDIIGAIGVAIDITDKKQAELALADARTRIDVQKKHLERVTEFIRATLEQMLSTINLGANRTELLDYVESVQLQFNRLRVNSPVDTPAVAPGKESPSRMP